MARGLFVTLLLALTCGIALSQCPSMFSGIENKEFDTPLSAGSDVDFSICGTVPKACTGSDPSCCAVCQQWSGGGACLGKSLTSVDTTTTAGQVKLTYTGGDDVDDPNPVNDGPRITVITISCGTGDMSNVAFTDASVNKNPNRKQGDTWTYLITASSSYACGGHFPGGGVFLILLLCVIVVYVVGIVVYHRLSSSEFGFPHAEFWLSTPFLAKDGAFFIVNKIRGQEGYSSL